MANAAAPREGRWVENGTVTRGEIPPLGPGGWLFAR